jgi:hypothetical protein
MDQKEIYYVKKDEKFDLAKFVEVLLKNAKFGEREKSISFLISNLSRDEKEILRDVLSIKAEAAREFIPFFERRKSDYKKGMGRSLFIKNRDLRREIKSTELALSDLTRMSSVVGDFLNQTISQVMEARDKFANSMGGISRVLAEGTGGNPLSLLEGNGNLETRMQNLERKIEALLDKSNRK